MDSLEFEKTYCSLGILAFFFPYTIYSGKFTSYFISTLARQNVIFLHLVMAYLYFNQINIIDEHYEF